MKKLLSASTFAAVCCTILFCGCEDKKAAPEAGKSGEKTNPAAAIAQDLTAGVVEKPVQHVVKGKKQGRQINAASELKQIGIGISLYSDDHDGKLPASIDQISSYCSGIDFSPYAYVGSNLTPGNSAGSIPIAFVKPQYLHSDTITILYADGHVVSKNIPGIAGMDCKQAAEKITADMKDKKLRNKIIKNAGKIK